MDARLSCTASGHAWLMTLSDEEAVAMLALGMPMAPSVLLQMVGPRVANHVLERMHEAFPERFAVGEGLKTFGEQLSRYFDIVEGSHRATCGNAITIASPIPGMAPRVATPTKQVIESQNSHCWMR